MSSSTSDTAHRLPHLPALDGLRGLAVIAVVLYHSEFSWARGGHLGVTTFFVLSGFLITSLLLLEHDREGRISLRAFWGRRARRLVPGALLAVALGGLWLGFGARSPGGRGAFGDGVASLFWVANWRFILQGSSYGDLFSEPSPFRHFWSLAIEEQFYLLLPLVVVGVLALASSRRSARLALAAVLAVAVGVSTELASLLHAPGDAPTRAYYGTDARLAEPALGALLAVLLIGGGGLRVLSGRWRSVLDGAGVVALGVLVWLATSMSVWNPHLYDGGLLLAALCAAVVIAAATQSGGVVQRTLSPAPLQAIGTISYGIYLFHWPVFLWISRQSTGLDDARLLLVRCTVTVTLASISYAAIEQPIRRGALLPRVAFASWANGAVAVVAGLALFTGMVTWPAPAARSTEVASGVNSLGAPAGRHEMAPARRAVAPVGGPRPAPQVAPTPKPAPEATRGQPSAPRAAVEPVRSGGAAPTPQQKGTPAAPAPTPPTRYRVAFIGDSVSQNLAGGMKRWGAAAGVEVLDLSIQACPISRGGDRRFAEDRPFPIPAGCDWWADPDSDHWNRLRAFAPDVIVVHDGLNELLDRKLDDWPKWMRPGEPVFNTWLISEYRELINAVAEQKIGLLLLNVPCADWNRYDNWRAMSDQKGRVDALNTAVYHEIGTSATRVVDLFTYMCPDGEFTNTVDGISDARPDGFHLSDRAAERAAEDLLAKPVFEIADSRRGATPTP